GFLDSGGGGGKKKKKNNSNDSPINTVMESANGDELNEVLGTTLDSEDTMNDDSPSGVASEVREGVTPSMDDTTIPGSFPPLSTPVFILLLVKPSGKKVAYLVVANYGRSSYARVMVELRADVELKDNIVMAMPEITREGHYTCNVRVEYEWKPPRCSSCKVFGHVHEECTKNTCAGEKKTVKKA
ncbi:retrovirus-related pol polyprotein from transposon TNT 1-94, partial [Tanacetum coccineum]